MVSSLHIIGSKKFGGAENFYVRLINAMHQEGHPVYAVNPPGSDVGNRIYPAIDQYHYKMRNIFDVASRWQIKSLIKRVQPDIVQTYMGRATRLTHINPKKRPVHIARLGGYYNLKGYQHAHAWVGNTKGICDYLVEKGCPKDKVFYVGNFVDTPDRHNDIELDQFRHGYEIPLEAKLVVTVGRAHVNKAFDTLLYAFKQIVRQNTGDDIYLIIVGDGPELEALKTLSESLEISEFVRFAGWQDQTSLFYQAADLFVCPSRHEPLGNVILEAWSHGSPVVSTRSQGALEITTSNHDCYLVDVDDIFGLAKGILYAIENPDMRKQLAKNGYEKIQTDFSRETIVSNYIDVYRQLLNE